MSKENKILITAIVISTLLIIGITFAVSNVVQKKVEVEKAELESLNIAARTSSGYSIYGSGTEVVDLIGTGIALNSGVASTTDTATIFQFASSTDQLYWDSTSTQPHMYGATPTAFVAMGGAEFATFNMYYDPENASSTVTCEFFSSNDDLCYVGDPDNNTSEWYPIPLSATTTPSDGSSTYATSSIVLQRDNSTGADNTDTIKHTFTLKDVNYECMKLQCYNNSTTDSSLLYANIRIK